MMEYLPESQTSATSYILCCECGCQIEPNPANMCVACLRNQVDISEDIPKQSTIHFCRACERYLQPPMAWIKAALESRELLAICLKKIKGLNKEVRLVDAGFIWTEPHSKRIKTKVTIQKEVMNGTVLQQVFVVEFVVHNQMCDDCHRVEAKDYWRACVQLRQKTHHKKTLFYLEQLILKHGAHINTSNIKQVHEGLDFFYNAQPEARKLVDFLQAAVPCRITTAKELISHDIHSNTFNYKMSWSVEIVPVCKDQIVCLPPKLAQHLGNLGQLCIVVRVTQTVHIIDPNTCQITDVRGDVFWRYPFSAISETKKLIEFTVMDCEVIFDKDKRHVKGHGAQSQKHVLSDVWVVRSSDLGSNVSPYHCRTHLGHLLAPGDTVLGLDLKNANVNNDCLDAMKPETIPDVILVKKLFADSRKRAKQRKWKLKRMEGAHEIDTDSVDRDYNEFMEDLEDDPAFRKNVNIYKDTSKMRVEPDSDSDLEGAPQISLAEMLDDLNLGADVTGEEGADMME